MDTAKGCNFILTNGGQMKDYWGIGKAKLPMLPLIAIPTTGGTGSECQSFALITDDLTHQKMGLRGFQGSSTHRDPRSKVNCLTTLSRDGLHWYRRDLSCG
jgi:alcohol dehydrogenase YqhD (iron-dependent ADH family)